MKKTATEKKAAPAKAAKPDIAALVTAMQSQLAALERKIDTLISQSSRPAFVPRPPSPPAPRAPYQHPQHHAPRPADGKGPNTFGPARTMYQAVCADCHKGCEVPFKPAGDRPIYCRDCFAKRKTANTPLAPKPFHARPPAHNAPSAPQQPSMAISAIIPKPADAPAGPVEAKRRPQHKHGAMRKFGERRNKAHKKRSGGKRRK